MTDPVRLGIVGCGSIARGFQCHAGVPSKLEIDIVCHPPSERYHAEAALELPGRTLFAGQWDAYLDSALEHCVDKLRRKAEAYRRQPVTAAQAGATSNRRGRMRIRCQAQA